MKQAEGGKRVRKLICWMRGHDYTIEKVYTATTRKLRCKRCNQRFGMNDDVKAVIPWDGELEQLHERVLPDVKRRFGLGEDRANE